MALDVVQYKQLEPMKVNSKLLVEELPIGSYGSVQAVIFKWIEEVEDKSEKNSKLTKSLLQRGLLLDSLLTLKQIRELLYKDRSYSFVVCRDANKEIQAIAMVKKVLLQSPEIHFGDHIFISEMLTNPTNLPVAVNPKENQVRGAGNCLVHEIFKKCVREKCNGVYLLSLDSAEDYWKNLGFTERAISNRPDHTGLYLSATKIEARLKTSEVI